MKSAIAARSNSDRWTSVLRATGIQMLGNHAGRQAGYTLSGTNVEMPCRSRKHVPRVSTRFARLTRVPHAFDSGTTFAIDVPPRV